MLYLAGAIDLALDHDVKNMVSQALSESGHVVYQPWGAFRVDDVDQTNGQGIKRVNLAAIGACDGMLAVFHRDQFTFGTVVDVEYALSAGVPVVVWLIGAKGQTPAYLTHYTVVHSEDTDIQGITDMLNALDGELKLNPLTKAIRGLPSAINAAMRARVAQGGSEGEDGPPVISGGHLVHVPCEVEAAHSMPTKAYQSDAGLDLYVHGTHFVMPGSWADVAVGTKMAIPEGYWGLILGRSSTFYKRGLTVHPAVIDAGYRGELRVAVHNPSDERVELSDKERVAQLILIPAVNARVHHHSPLPEGERGDKGFGSSGA